MKRLSLSLLIFSLIISFNLNAQVGNISFENSTHDFGKINEEIGSAVYAFKFTNTGDGDLKLLNVRTSCGCTASEYTKTPIKPGKTGEIKVTYHTSHRPGSFRKSITVTINNPDKPNTVLFIKGFVIAKAKSKGDLYPTAIGNLKFMSNHVALNEVKTSEIKTDSMKIYNNWTSPMTVEFDQLPSHIKARLSTRKNIIPNGAEAYIIITYDAKLKKDFGLVYDRIQISTNDVIQPKKTLNLSARIIQDFSNLTEKELNKAPKIVFASTDYNFETIKSGTVITYKFEFKNEGKQPLDILKVKTSCGCTTTTLSSNTYKKGKTGEIEVSFNTSGRTGRQHKTITVITNDPQNPEITLNINGDLN